MRFAIFIPAKWGQVLNLDFSLITPGFHGPNVSGELFLLSKSGGAILIFPSSRALPLYF